MAETHHSELARLAAECRRLILEMTSRAGSGHPTSSLSATDLMVGLFFGGTLRYDLRRPQYPGNDRVIFSKGHASSLLYALYALAGALSPRQLATYRQAGSSLEGHPRPNFRYAEAATGSLGQGLAIGFGMAASAKQDRLPYRTFVLLGDSELAEGSCWEAAEAAAFHQLDNLVAIIDVNGLGQRGPTMLRRRVSVLQRRFAAFGWRTIIINGHDLAAVQRAFAWAARPGKRPAVIIAETIKGYGSAVAGRTGWHGKVLPDDLLVRSLGMLTEPKPALPALISAPPRVRRRRQSRRRAVLPTFIDGSRVSTRQAFGSALAALGHSYPELVVLDGEVGNSTYTNQFAERFPKRFYELYIAEQQMAAAAVGMSRRGHLPVMASFAAFLSRAHDQIRMSQYSQSRIVFVGSHAGVAIGPDGPSQMGLEDIALFRGLFGSVVLYPADAHAAVALTAAAAAHRGISYLRTTRGATPVLPVPRGGFRVGGSRALRRSAGDHATVVAAGVTVFEAMAAADALAKQGVAIRVIDAYSIKPLDLRTLRQAARQTGRILTVEDHGAAGGLGEAVAAALATEPAGIRSLAVNRLPGSATPDEQLRLQGIDRIAIIKALKGAW